MEVIDRAALLEDKVQKTAGRKCGAEKAAENRERGVNQEAKADAGKLELDLVPRQIIRDIAEIRMYGNRKYGSPDNWKTVELRRYINAMLRHTLAFLDDMNGVDTESGLAHYKHVCCNWAFICEMMEWKRHEAV